MTSALRSAAIVTTALALCLLGPRARAESAPDNEACFSAYEDAQRLRKKKALLAARGELIACGAETCPTALRGDCVTWLAELEKLLPTVVFSVKSGGAELSGARVTVDGAPIENAVGGAAIALDPGQRRLRVEAAEHEPFERELLIREGEKARPIAIELRRAGVAESEQPAISTPVIVLAAVGALALTSFGVFAVKSHAARSDLSDCKGHCAEEDVDAVRRDQIIADVSLGIGIGALGIAAYLHFGSGSSSRSSNASSWSLGVAPLAGGGRASVAHAW